MCDRCDQLEAVIRDLQASEAALSGDKDALAYKLAQSAKAEIALKTELRRRDEDIPERAEIQELLEFARTELGKNRLWNTAPGSDRYALAERRLKAITKVYTDQGRKPTEAKTLAMDALKTAIVGLANHPYAGPRGRQPLPYPGSKRFNDLVHALGDDDRFELCWKLATGMSWSDQDPDAEANDVAWANAIGRVRNESRRWTQQELAFQETWDRKEPVDRVLDALMAHGIDWQQRGQEFWFCCPVHDDRTPSCSVREGDNGSAVVHCFGCGADGEQVAEALGLSSRDLFPNDSGPRPILMHQRKVAA